MKMILFDFDGVLANTINISYNIHTIKNKNLTWQHFKDYSMGNFHDGYERAVKDGKHIPADDFYGDYKKGLNTLTIEEMLHNIILSLAKKYKLAIVSSTDSSYIKDFLAKEKLDGCFSDVLGADVHRSKTFKIKNILEKYGLSSTDAVFVTDTLGDIKEGGECNVESIAVTWGLHDRDILEKGKPIAIIDNPQDLISAIEGVLK